MRCASQSPVIAVDGPAASGKGTIARALADRFDIPHMDTGLLYRAVALVLFRFGGDPASEFEAARAAHDIDKIASDDEELRSEVVGSIAETFVKYPSTGTLLPAMGYGDEQTEELRETIARSDADLVLIGTPIDLRRLIDFDRPALRVTYRLEEVGEPTLAQIFADRGLISQQAFV